MRSGGSLTAGRRRRTASPPWRHLSAGRIAPTEEMPLTREGDVRTGRWTTGGVNRVTFGVDLSIPGDVGYRRQGGDSAIQGDVQGDVPSR